MKPRLFRFILIFLAAAAVVVVVLTLVNRADKSAQALPIDTYLVTRGALVEQVTGTGSFKPDEAATIAARVSGQVVQIPVEEGEKVDAGQVVMRIDSSDYRLAVDQARSALETTRRTVRQSLVTLRASYRSTLTSYEQAKRAYDKNRELYAAKAISGDELKASEDGSTTASVALQSAREQLNLRLGEPLGSQPNLDASDDEATVEASPEVVQAMVSLKTAQENLDKCTVRSPMNGTVTSILPSVGDLVAQNAVLVKIEDLSTMLAEVQIDEVDIGKLSLGNDAEVTSDSLIGQTVHGRVKSIAPTITTAGSTRVSTVKISLTTAGMQLRSGASCSVKITTRTKADVLNIPITAFFSRGGGERVYVLSPIEEQAHSGAQGHGSAGDGAEASGGSTGGAERSGKPQVYRLVEKTITTGISTINSIEVTSGLAKGEIVANGSLPQLRAGMFVTPKETL